MSLIQLPSVRMLQQRNPGYLLSAAKVAALNSTSAEPVKTLSAFIPLHSLFSSGECSAEDGGPQAAGFCLLARARNQLPASIIRATAVMVSVARTLISGLTPRRTLENTTMGKVLVPGPEVKLEITRSSHDNVKASSQPERMAGKMIGRVMTKNTLTGRAPRSIAASSSAVSK